MTTDQNAALYVYAFVRPGDAEEISAPGIDGTADVTTRALGEIDAVVSPLELEEFQGPEAEDHLTDLDWVAPRAMRHEDVIEEVMETSPVLPLTFGVIFSSEQALSEAVDARQGRIAEFLDYIADKEEWAVKVYANPREVRGYLERSQKFRERVDQLPASPGARYFEEKRLERELEHLAERERRDMAERIREELAPGAIEVKSLRLSTREMTGRQDDMVMNTALLARADQVDRFLEQVRRLADEYRPRGLTIEASGPWPPYNFCPSLQGTT